MEVTSCRENLGAGIEEAAPQGSQRSPQRNPVGNKKLCERPGIGADDSRSSWACREPPRPAPNQSPPTHPQGSRTSNAAPPAGTQPTCGGTPASAASPTASAAPTNDDSRVGALPTPAPPPPSRQPLCFPSPFPAPARSRAPAPAAPPVRSGPARHRPLALAPSGGAGGAAVRSPLRAGGVPIACHAPGLPTPLGLLAMDVDDSRARKGSLRKFLEHLSGPARPSAY
ncbi:vegetative cell wall protein gp1-like [Rhinopithecus roxellana]|uniref:vegetative cell wall protein gp1-like n=1 Tax=Rhinopithecus roxellana TaxID=61622 RepID=UPI00123746E7|nr:vegetative cell wall protein gp1-like [Rhinopithecus roxellana]